VGNRDGRSGEGALGNGFAQGAEGRRKNLVLLCEKREQRRVGACFQDGFLAFGLSGL